MRPSVWEEEREFRARYPEQAAELDRLRKAAAPSPGETLDGSSLASAMRKLLPPPLLAEVIAHLDPLTPFIEALRAAAPAIPPQDDDEKCSCSADRTKRGWRDPHCPEHGEFPPAIPEGAGETHGACHDLVCNASRRHPRGAQGVGCSCFTRAEREAAEVARLRAAPPASPEAGGEKGKRDAVQEVREVRAPAVAPDLSLPTMSAEETARAWLTRQIVVDGREPMLDEGDCRLCGSAAGEGHEDTDPCGIVAALLADLDRLRAAPAIPAASLELASKAAAVQSLERENDQLRADLARVEQQLSDERLTFLRAADTKLAALQSRWDAQQQELTNLRDDATWRHRWHDRLGRGEAETEGKFYERLQTRWDAQQQALRALSAEWRKHADVLWLLHGDVARAAELCADALDQALAAGDRAPTDAAG